MSEPAQSYRLIVQDHRRDGAKKRTGKLERDLTHPPAFLKDAHASIRTHSRTNGVFTGLRVKILKINRNFFMLKTVPWVLSQ